MLRLLINPLARGAYFNQLDSVVEAELKACFTIKEIQRVSIGALDFIDVDLDQSLATQLMRLSWVQAVFQAEPSHPLALSCLDILPQFHLPSALVWGQKYRGKTHELVTQMALNIVLKTSEHTRKAPTLIDPMAGRGTTLLWAARYGIDAYGVEIEPQSVEHFERDVKRQTKLHRLKHRTQQSASKKSKKRSMGRYFEFTWPESVSRLTVGDTREVQRYVAGKRFTHLVTDLPYGVQFGGGQSRNPLKLIQESASTWFKVLYPGAAAAIIFNALQPKRSELEELFRQTGFDILPFSAAHRMSESIERDIVLLRRPK